MIPTVTSRTKQAGKRAPRRAAGSSYWLIVRDGDGPIEALILDTGSDRYSERALPVFSFEEEAGMFLWLGGVGDGWRARETSAGELISVLHGLCSSVRDVALDPLPEMMDRGAVGLVSLGRDRFIEHVMARRDVYTWT